MATQRVFSAQAGAISADLVEIEADVSVGLFSFTVIGLPDKAVEESRDRVSSAIKNSGFKSPKSQNHKIVISLAPANVKKEGSSFDVPMALSYLLASKQIVFDSQNKIFIGELSLDGTAKKVRGVLPILQFASKFGFQEVFVPSENLIEAALFKQIKVFGYKNLQELVSFLKKEKEFLESPPEIIKPKRNSEKLFENIKGQELIKRALIISAAGKHNLAMWGPPGSGKTLLAKSYIEILPELNEKELMEVNSIYSRLGIDEPIFYPPFRSPHHSASYASVIGGRSSKELGEITLAHNGVLFMDEFPEFDKRTIESLREPLESGEIRISRADKKEILPAKFTLIAAFNPCPCGFLGSNKTCLCTPASVLSYKKKLSGPIVDRIDLIVKVLPVENQILLSENTKTDDIEKIREKIFIARKIQENRIGKTEKISDSQKKLLSEVAKKLNLSSRVVHKIIKVSRTIADLENSEKIRDENLLEAISYRGNF